MMNGDASWQLRQLMQIHELFLIGDLLWKVILHQCFIPPRIAFATSNI